MHGAASFTVGGGSPKRTFTSTRFAAVPDALNIGQTNPKHVAKLQLCNPMLAFLGCHVSTFEDKASLWYVSFAEEQNGLLQKVQVDLFDCREVL